MVLYSLPLFKDHSVFAHASEGFAPSQLGVLGDFTESAHLLAIDILNFEAIKQYT